MTRSPSSRTLKSGACSSASIRPAARKAAGACSCPGANAPALVGTPMTRTDRLICSPRAGKVLAGLGDELDPYEHLPDRLPKLLAADSEPREHFIK